MNGFTAGEEPAEQVTRFDAEKLLREKRGDRQAMMTGGGAAITPDKQGLMPFQVDARYSTADIFPMFDMPFLFGAGWSATEDERHGRVAVIAKALNDKLFGGGQQRRQDRAHGQGRVHRRRRARRMAADAALLRHEQRPVRRAGTGIPALLDLP